MYLVKTYVDKSPIEGIGSFAGEDIKAGTVVWRWHCGRDWTFTVQQMISSSEDVSNRVTLVKHSWRKGNTYYYCIDDAKYQNHSYDPNTISQDVGHEMLQIACRDIKKGEEITCNYAEFDEDFNDKFKGHKTVV